MPLICEQFSGFLRDLCEGRGREGRPDPLKVASDSFRIRYGLAPLSDDPDERIQQLAEESDIPLVPRSSSVEPKLQGPGRELEAIFEQLGIPYREACGCAAYARLMDEWGVAGCRSRFAEIVERLRENAAEYSLGTHLAAAGRAVLSGLFVTWNPLDPFSSLVSEAIRRAEVAEMNPSANAI